MTLRVILRYRSPSRQHSTTHASRILKSSRKTRPHNGVEFLEQQIMIVGEMWFRGNKMTGAHKETKYPNVEYWTFKGTVQKFFREIFGRYIEK